MLQWKVNQKKNWKQLNKDSNITEYHIPEQAVVSGNLEDSSMRHHCCKPRTHYGKYPGKEVLARFGTCRSLQRGGPWWSSNYANSGDMKKHPQEGKHFSTFLCFSWNSRWSQRLPFAGLCGKLGWQLKRQRGYPLKMGQAIFHSFVLDFLLEPVFVILV